MASPLVVKHVYSDSLYPYYGLVDKPTLEGKVIHLTEDEWKDYLRVQGLFKLWQDRIESLMVDRR